MKTFEELNIKPIYKKNVSPALKDINTVLYEYSTTPVSVSMANSVKTKMTELLKTNTDVLINNYIQIITDYISTYKWDKDTLQRMGNYTVVRWIKTRQVSDDYALIQQLQKWKYVKDTINESPFKDELNLKSFVKVNKEIIDELHRRYQ